MLSQQEFYVVNCSRSSLYTQMTFALNGVLFVRAKIFNKLENCKEILRIRIDKSR